MGGAAAAMHCGQLSMAHSGQSNSGLFFGEGLIASATHCGHWAAAHYGQFAAAAFSATHSGQLASQIAQLLPMIGAFLP